MLFDNPQFEKISDIKYLEGIEGRLNDDGEPEYRATWLRSFKNLHVDLTNIRISECRELHHHDYGFLSADDNECAQQEDEYFQNKLVHREDGYSTTINAEAKPESFNYNFFALNKTDENNIFDLERHDGKIFITIHSVDEEKLIQDNEQKSKEKKEAGAERWPHIDGFDHEAEELIKLKSGEEPKPDDDIVMITPILGNKERPHKRVKKRVRFNEGVLVGDCFLYKRDGETNLYFILRIPSLQMKELIEGLRKEKGSQISLKLSQLSLSNDVDDSFLDVISTRDLILANNSNYCFIQTLDTYLPIGNQAATKSDEQDEVNTESELSEDQQLTLQMHKNEMQMERERLTALNGIKIGLWVASFALVVLAAKVIL